MKMNPIHHQHSTADGYPGLSRRGFLRGVSAPLAIGTLELDDGTAVHGFVCDPTALEGARDITAYGGWRSYMAAAADDLNRAADAS